MTMPNPLRQLIENALVEVRNDSIANLNRELLVKIGATVGELLDSVRVLDDAYRRRISLIMLTVKHVLPIWERAHPQDTSPQHLLNSVEQLLVGRIDIEMISDAEYGFLDWLDRQSGSCEDNPALCVAFSLKALLQALETVGGLYGNSPPHSAENSANAAIAFAADAYINDARRESVSDIVKRREFWEWWLTETVPMAWATVF